MRGAQNPVSIAALGALGSGLAAAIIVELSTRSHVIALVTLLAVFLVGGVIFYYLLQRFIYRKIKIIYKNIFRFKKQTPSLRKVLGEQSTDPIEQVSQEVLSWMRSNQVEIDRLKEQARFRREFLGNVSHELKTPVQSIQGYIHTLLDGALDDPKVNRKFLMKAGNGVDRLVNLINDLTSISDFENRGIKLDLKSFDLAELVDEAFDMVRHLADEKHIRFGYKKMSSKSFKVMADRNRIMQVLVNLFVNAIKYGRNGGEVLVGFYDVDKNVLVEISDNGEGIAVEHLPRLFERFYRTDQGRSRDEGGSGLGLSIVKHIIEAHDQTVNVRSTVGEGSTFGFTLEKV